MTEVFNVVSESSDSDLGSDGRVISKYERVYRFRTDSMTRPTASAISTAMGIYPGSPFADDSNATAHKFSVRGDSKPTRAPFLSYLVTIGWATNAPLCAENNTDPTTRRQLWKIKATTQQRHEISYNDGTEDILIVNTAGQPFEGGVPINVRTGVFTVSRNVDATGYDRGVVMRLSGAINTDVWNGCEPGTVQVDIESDEKYEGGYHFWEESYTFNYDKNGHQPKPANCGFYELDGTDLVRIKIDGKDVMEPEPLDEFGALVPVGDRPDDCIVLEIPYFEELDFGTTFSYLT